MKHKSVYLVATLVLCVAFLGVTVAQRPEMNVDPKKNPNLAEAQHHIMQAYESVEASQKATNDKLGGHGEKAKQLLEQAAREVKEAAEYADHH